MSIFLTVHELSFIDLVAGGRAVGIGNEEWDLSSLSFLAANHTVEPGGHPMLGLFSKSGDGAVDDAVPVGLFSVLDLLRKQLQPNAECFSLKNK